MKRTTLIFLFVFLALYIFSFGKINSFVFAQEEIEINFFYSQSCPHCAQEEVFLEELEKDYPELKINEYAVSGNIELLKKLYTDYNVPQKEYGLVPITFIDGNYFLGFSHDIGQKIEDCVLEKVKNKEESCNQEGEEEISSESVTPVKIDNSIFLPLIGEINTEQYSLPVLAFMLGFFDGFNVCSLGALVLILGLVLALKQRKKIFLFGGIFILATALVYGLLIVLWYQIFSFFASYLRTMEIIVGLLGITGGFYFFRQFIRYKKHGALCETNAGQGIINKFFDEIKKALQESRNLFLITAMVLLFACVITVVEFPCSAAVPLFFAGILAEAQLPELTYLVYIAIFIFSYMLDEIAIFLIAAVTMTIKISSPKFITWISLVEAVILFVLGIYYLFGISIFV